MMDERGDRTAMLPATYGNDEVTKQDPMITESMEEVTMMKTEVVEESYYNHMTNGETNSFNIGQFDTSDYVLRSQINLVLVKGVPGKSSGLEDYHFKEEFQENSCSCEQCCLEFGDHLQNQCKLSPFKKSELAHNSLSRNQDVFICPFCKVEISEKKYYGRHIKWCERNCIILSKRGEFTMRIKRIFKCEKCSYIAKNNFNLQRHALVHSDEKQFKCVTCGRSFRRNSPLRDHIKTHSTQREKKVTCPYCKNNYYRKSALTRHIQVKHSDYVKYKCDACEYATTDELLLKKHISSKHSELERRYDCEFCDYSTENKGHLTNHYRTHSGTKPFKCTYKYCNCGQLSIQKVCECKTCEFATAHQTNLRKHILQKHSTETKKYKCTECNYSTHMKGDLTTHIRIHTNDKPFKCGYQNCTYKSTRRQHLKVHIRHRHTKEKLYQCDKCNYTCVSSCNLKRHSRRKHI